MLLYRPVIIPSLIVEPTLCVIVAHQLKRVPILRKLWQAEKDAGVNVTLKDGAEFDLEAAEREDAEREERRQQEGDDDGSRRRSVVQLWIYDCVCAYIQCLFKTTVARDGLPHN